jgi:hypothetical protein
VFGIQGKNHGGTDLTNGAIGAFTGASFKEHVKIAAARSSASDEPVMHQSNDVKH